MDENLKILCVEDDLSVLNALTRFFFDSKYTVLQTTSAMEGLDILGRENVHIVISDYYMPGMNGVTFLEKVYERWPETFRIILTGYDETEVIISAINKGHIYKFITKPWNDKELKTTISNLEKAIKKQNAEKRVIENAELFSTTLSSIGDAVITTDTKGIVTFMNPKAEALTNRKQEKVRMRQLNDIFKIINNETNNEDFPLSEVINNGITVMLKNHSLLLNNGKMVPVSDSMAPIKNRKGDILGAVLVISSMEEQSQLEGDNNELINVQEEPLINVKSGSKLIPICAACKNIRDPNGFWDELEQYMTDHFGIKFTHGMCPDCSREYYPGLYKD